MKRNAKARTEAYILDSMTRHQGCQTIDVAVNGETRSVPGGLSVLNLLQWLEIDPERVAVELNREIVRQPQWPLTEVANGARLEIVQFVGGG
jgi:thiamine biosynthesis protein ThiS